MPAVPAESILREDILPKSLPHAHATRPTRNVATARSSGLHLHQLTRIHRRFISLVTL